MFHVFNVPIPLRGEGMPRFILQLRHSAVLRTPSSM
jgi:hypothetical protein